MRLSVLCITKAEKHALGFCLQMREACDRIGAELVIVQDGGLEEWVVELADRAAELRSRGYIESVLDEALDFTSGEYVLRLDDDESMSEEMIAWLGAEEYMSSDVWSFPRKHLWEGGYIPAAPLYPDLQTRLSVREKAGGRRELHVGSPFGAGKTAPADILHHKFLAKSFAERKAIAADYDELREGGGTGHWLPFNLPENYYSNIEVMPL